MGSLVRFNKIACFPQLIRTYASAPKGLSPWYRDNAPGPYPKTEEEKVAAAKKYGLLREEYEPYPDDGDGFGDYPKLPHIPLEARDPNYPWTDKVFRRNHGEPYPADIFAFTTGRVTDERRRHSTSKMISYFLAAVGFFFICEFVFDDLRIYPHRMEKHLYEPGVVRYTFELEDGSESSGKKHH